jgi:lysophospholipase L1-like esterase
MKPLAFQNIVPHVSLTMPGVAHRNWLDRAAAIAAVYCHRQYIPSSTAHCARIGCLESSHNLDMFIDVTRNLDHAAYGTVMDEPAFLQQHGLAISQDE